MRIEGLGDALVEQLVEKKIVSDVGDLYRLKLEDVADSGKALPIPVGPQPVYAEAIFLQRGPQSTLPQLQGVVVVQDTRVVMEPTLSAALERLRSGQ